MRAWYLLVGLFVVVLVGCTSERTEPPVSSEPVATTASVTRAEDISEGLPIEFLDGVPLSIPSNLVLLSGDTIVDVDTDASRRLDGLPVGEDLVVGTVAVGEGAVVLVCAVKCDAPELFAVDGHSGVAQSIGFGLPAPAPDGVWATRHVSETACTLSKLGLDGTILISERPFDCDISVVEETSMGLVAVPNSRPELGAILDPETLDTLFQTDRIIAVLDGRVLSFDGDSFTLLDPVNDSGTEIARPTDIGVPSYGRISPDGRLVAISFEHPAWPGPRQRLDVWVLEVATLEWVRLPSMPVSAALKTTTEAWAPDGRFVMFGSFEEAGHDVATWRDVVATWRPGDRALGIRELDASPAASLVVWATTSP